MFKSITTLTLGTVAVFALTATAGTGMTPTAATVKGDCARVAKADRSLCSQVRGQHAYGWTTADGTPLNWVPNGRALVKEITHQGLTAREIHDYLTGERANYREHVTDVSFNTDEILTKCGHTDGYGFVQFIDEDGKPGGRKYVWSGINCD